MALTSISSGLAVVETIEFVGIGPAGKRRVIDSFDYVTQAPLNRVNAVAPPGQDWMALFSEWLPKPSLHVSVFIRSGNAIVLRLNEVIPLYFVVTALDVTESKAARALSRWGADRGSCRRCSHASCRRGIVICLSQCETAHGCSALAERAAMR